MEEQSILNYCIKNFLKNYNTQPRFKASVDSKYIGVELFFSQGDLNPISVGFCSNYNSLNEGYCTAAINAFKNLDSSLLP
ncbi:hypothetical protein [Fusobacterium sp.]|uniref:hypothetical protein n=1 Tax=Fusobacterium sp. TaxID=68766 RepID=UPI000C702BB3|nr:hypothetical protein [Fusobacterium sp.]